MINMGLYDTIKVFTQCPYCGKHDTFKTQTKQLGKGMNHYETVQWFDHESANKEDFNLYGGHIMGWRLEFEDEFYHDTNSVHVIAGCESSLCQWWADVRDVHWQGTPSGFGRHWEFDIPVKEINGKRYLIGVQTNIKLDDLTEEQFDNWENDLREDERELYERALEKLIYPPFALRFRHRFGKISFEEEQS